MTEIDEVTTKRKRGRKKKLSSRDTQHSFYADPDLWDAAGNLPIPRPDIIREALLNAVSFYQSDLPKLKWQLEEVRAQKHALEARESVIISRIEQFEANVVIEINDQQKALEAKEIAVTETLTMCRAFKKNMGYAHYAKLEELSGIDAARIEAFLKDTKFRPKEETVRVFYNG